MTTTDAILTWGVTILGVVAIIVGCLILAALGAGLTYWISLEIAKTWRAFRSGKHG